MAEDIAARVRRKRGGRGKQRDAFSGDDIAKALVPRRDRLVVRLPRELAVARGLTADQAELVVDEAIDYLVTQYRVPIYSAAELERAFWAAAAIRARRTHDGRDATVRAGWTRVDVDGRDLPSTVSEPEAAALEQGEVESLLEFAATLTDLERRVLSFRFEATGRLPGAVTISRELGVSIGEVRSVELSLDHKLRRFIAIMASGNLCRHRAPLVAALALGGLTEASERLARVHLEHCPACQLDYAARLRDLKSGKLPRDVASILPVPAGDEMLEHPRAFWDALTDWASRPFAHDAAITGTQLGTAGRGLGGLAAVKLATLCIGGASLVGGSLYCVTSTDLLHRKSPRPATDQPSRQASRPQRSGPKEELSYLKARPTPTPTPRQRRQRQARPAVATPAPTAFASEHESAAAVSPPPPNAAPGGASEFGPTSTQAATQPAPPASGGGTEFP